MCTFCKVNIPAHLDIVEATGVENYNLEIDVGVFKMLGVLNTTGDLIHFWGTTNKMEIMKWLSDEDLEILKEDREPADAPRDALSLHHIIDIIC